MKNLDHINSPFDLEPGSRPVMKCGICGHVQELPINAPEADDVGCVSIDEFTSEYVVICDVCRSFNNATIFIRPLVGEQK